MNIDFTTNHLKRPDPAVGELTDDIQDFLATTGELNDLNAQEYGPINFIAPYFTKVSVQAAAYQMARDSNFMNKNILPKLATALIRKIDNTPEMHADRKKQHLESFARETAVIINSTSLSVMQTQAFNAFEIIKDRNELKDFTIVMNEKSYNEAKRNSANSKAGRTGLDAFKL